MGTSALGIRALVRLANRNSKARELLSDWSATGPRTIQFELVGEESFHVKVDSGMIAFSKGRHARPDALLRGNADVFAGIVTGSLDPDEAYSRQRYDIIGSIDDAIRFRYLGELVLNMNKLGLRLMRGALGLLTG